MSYRLIIRDSEALLLTADRATQDLRQQANYILVNGNAHAAGQFLELAEVTFAQLATIPKMGVDFCPPIPPAPPSPQLWGEKRGNRNSKSPRIGGFRGLILRVLHGARDLEGILSNLDEEI